MSFPTKGRRGEAEEAPAEFYDRTRQIVREAAVKRDHSLLRRAAIRIDSQRFDSLSDSRQEELSELYAEAAVVCGVGSLA